jgi:hypothetical protein
MDNEETQLAIWRLFLARTQLLARRHDAEARGDADAAREADTTLAALPEVPVRDALRANAQLISGLSNQRWIGMKVARDQGLKMEEIGSELGISKQAAWEFLKRKIEEHGDTVPLNAAPPMKDNPFRDALDRIGFIQSKVSDPIWNSFLTVYSEGDEVTCTVIRRTFIGAEVEIEGGMPAFLPIFPASSAPKVGDVVRARIVGVDEKGRHVGVARIVKSRGGLA